MISLPFVLALIGCLTLLVSLFRGGTKAINLLSLLIGLVFIGIAVRLSSISSQPPGITTEEQFKLFMSFYYPEIKDLTINFLTLSSSTFVFSVVFAEKVVTFRSPFTKSHYPIIISWVLFAVSIGLGGLGLWWLYTAGEIANGSLVVKYHLDFIQLLRNVYMALDIAGFSFVGALMMLAISALTKLWKQEETSTSKSV